MVVSLGCKQNGVYTVRKKSRFQKLYKENTIFERNPIVVDVFDAENQVVSIRNCAGKVKICAPNTKSLSKPEMTLNLKAMMTQKNERH